MTPVELYWALEDHWNRTTMERRTLYELTRFLATSIWNISGKVLKEPMEPQQLMRFDWDVPKVQKMEDMLAHMKSFAKSHNARLKKKEKFNSVKPKRLKK